MEETHFIAMVSWATWEELLPAEREREKYYRTNTIPRGLGGSTRDSIGSSPDKGVRWGENDDDWDGDSRAFLILTEPPVKSNF